MEDFESSGVNTNFWWLRHDWVKYKNPVSEGKVIIPHDYLVPGYTIDPTEHWYSFIDGRRDRRKIADFSGWGGGAFFVNERAYGAFEDMFLRHGRAFPVRCSSIPHYIVLIDSMHDAIDMNRSIFVRSSNDDGPIEDDISQVKRIILKVEFSTKDDIFRINRGFALSQDIIVSEHFTKRYEQSGLTGLLFSDTKSAG